MRIPDALDRGAGSRRGGVRAARLVVTAALALHPGELCLAAGGDRPASQLIAACAACHRLDNRSNGMPPIVGLGPAQVVNMMSAFKARTQSGGIMHVVGRSLSPTEIVAIADYLEALEKAKSP